MAFHPSKDGPTSDSSQDSGKVAGQIDLLTLTACIDTQHSPVWTDSCEFSLRMTKSANHVQLLKWLRSSMDRFALVLSTNSGTWKKRHIFSQRNHLASPGRWCLMEHAGDSYQHLSDQKCCHCVWTFLFQAFNMQNRLKLERNQNTKSFILVSKVVVAVWLRFYSTLVTL